jgi:hypothetical protein
MSRCDGGSVSCSLKEWLIGEHWLGFMRIRDIRGGKIVIDEHCLGSTSKRCIGLLYMGHVNKGVLEYDTLARAVVLNATGLATVRRRL